MGHFPINYTSFAVDIFLYINVCHLKKIIMIFISLQVTFHSAVLLMARGTMQPVDGVVTGQMASVAARMVQLRDGEGWKVKDGRWRMEGEGGMAQRQDWWHGWGRNGTEGGPQMKMIPGRGWRWKEGKTDEVSGSWERGKVCFKGKYDSKYRQLPCLEIQGMRTCNFSNTEWKMCIDSKWNTLCDFELCTLPWPCIHDLEFSRSNFKKAVFQEWEG